MTSYSNLLQDLLGLHENEMTWVSTDIPLAVATSIDNDDPMVINLAETLGKGKNVNKGLVPQDACWLPQKFNKNTKQFRTSVLAPFFVLASKESGFLVAMKGWEPKKNYATFFCVRGRHYQKNPPKNQAVDEAADETVEPPPEAPELEPPAIPVVNSGAPAAVKSQRPVKGVHTKCNFRFNVYWDPTSSRWFLPKEQRGNANHCGHGQTPSELLRVRAKTTGLDAIELAQQALSAQIRAASVQALLRERTGIELETSQIRHINRKAVNESLRLNMAETGHPGGDDPDYHPTAADRLLLNLDNCPTASYVVIFADCETDSLRIRARSKNSDGDASVTDLDPNDLADPADSAERFSIKVRDALSITGTGQILLALAWTYDESRRKFAMFPEFVGSDVTKGTNKEERPLQTFCSKDSNNKGFTHTWAFLPSESHWVFVWFLGTAVPQLHSRSTCERVQVALTDQDRQECQALQDLCGPGTGRVFVNAIHRLCGFHKLNRNLTQKTEYLSIIAATKSRSISGGIEFDVIVSWLWSFIKRPMTVDQAAHSHELLCEHLNEDESKHTGTMGDDLRELLIKYADESFFALRNKLFHHVFADVSFMGNWTSNVNEAEHRTLKWMEGGPKPSDALDIAQKRIAAQTQKRDRAKDRQVAFDMTGVVTNSSLAGKTVVEVTGFCNTLLQKRHSLSSKQQVFRVSQTQFWVKLVPKEGPGKSMETTDQSVLVRKKHRSQWIIPEYETTHAVSIHESNGQLFARCTCNLFVQKKHACEHHFAILKRAPKATDANIRWWTHYAFYYGREGKEALTGKLTELRDVDLALGVPIELDDVRELESGCGSRPRQWFEESLNAVKLRGPSYWTIKTRLGPDGAILPPEAVRRDFGSRAGVGWRGPVGMTTEVRLSQQQMSQLTQPQSDSDDGGWAARESDDDDNPELGVAGLSAIMENASFDDPEDLDPDLQRHLRMGAYSAGLPVYKDLASRVKTKEEWEVFISGLHDLDSKLLAMKATRGMSQSTGGSNLHGLPETDSRRSDTRLRPIGSPAKKRSRRTRNRDEE